MSSLGEVLRDRIHNEKWFTARGLKAVSDVLRWQVDSVAKLIALLLSLFLLTRSINWLVCNTILVIVPMLLTYKYPDEKPSPETMIIYLFCALATTSFDRMLEAFPLYYVMKLPALLFLLVEPSSFNDKLKKLLRARVTSAKTSIRTGAGVDEKEVKPGQRSSVRSSSIVEAPGSAFRSSVRSSSIVEAPGSAFRSSVRSSSIVEAPGSAFRSSVRSSSIVETPGSAFTPKNPGTAPSFFSLARPRTSIDNPYQSKAILPIDGGKINTTRSIQSPDASKSGFKSAENARSSTNTIESRKSALASPSRSKSFEKSPSGQMMPRLMPSGLSVGRASVASRPPVPVQKKKSATSSLIRNIRTAKPKWIPSVKKK